MKTIKHKWDKLGFQHHKCPKCLTERVRINGETIWTNRFGKSFHFTPSCVLPNTRL